MAIKIRIPRRKRPTSARAGRFSRLSRHKLYHQGLKVFLIAVLVSGLAGVGVFSYYWVKYDRIITRRIRGPIFSNAAKIYARAAEVSVGDKLTPENIAVQLRRAGYGDAAHGGSPMGSYRLIEHGIEIKPGPLSYHNADGAIIRVSGGAVDRIVGLGSADGRDLTAYELEPQLLTSLDTEERAKRQIVKYNDVPKVMVQAVTSIEDRKFFQHSGINYLRVVGAVWEDIREGRRGQGGSTLTMQIARGFFLTPQKTLKRKLTEMLIATELEQKLTKEQIFEVYANWVDMGQRGSYAIRGFAEAARSYFNKDLRSITLPEAALLAGIVQRPSALSPYRHPERALQRRNLVLDSMVETGAITREEAEKAKATPLKLAPPNVEASDAPYFVDLVKDLVTQKYGEREVNDQSYRIYTTLDPDLQRAAADAVQAGIKNVDEQVAKMRTRRKKVGSGRGAKTETVVAPGPQAQVALVAIDRQTGEVLALVGGRNYGASQLNHAVARRPTGSVFKPFVYAAAMNTALTGSSTVWTPSSMVDDEPTTFIYGDQVYEPRNYKQEYHGQVTATYALAHSLNNATVRLAEQVGYEEVAKLARAAGLKSVQPTPAMALGAYDAQPLDMASAYTVFANDGVRVSTTLIKSVNDAQANVVDTFSPTKTPVLDPRVAYVMTSMMEAVVNNGYGYTVRQYGFTAPAAGKTGTSHDGWFAGYTSNLLCIVWVGFDDYSDLKLSGATAAAPIWAEFMKRAAKLTAYRNMKDFKQPEGVIDVRLDKITNLLATAACPDSYSVAFVIGTEPKQTCEQGPGSRQNVLSKIFGFMSGAKPPPNVVPPPPVNGKQPVVVQSQANAANGNGQLSDPTQKDPKKEKKGFFGKLSSIFKGDSKDKDSDAAGTGQNPQKSPR